MFKITAIAPTRVDLAGGTIDLWPIHNLLDRKATVNVAVNLNAVVEVSPSQDSKSYFLSEDQNISDTGDYRGLVQSNKLRLFSLLFSAIWKQDLPPISIKTNAKSPAGAGLGGSSCLAVAFCRALAEARKHFDSSYQIPDERGIIRIAQDVESRVIHAPTGVQDYWGGVRGGINILEFPYGDTIVTTIPGTAWETQDLKLICCYSGKSRASAINNWEIFKRIFDGDQALLDKISAIGVESSLCAESVLKGHWAEAFAASHREWELRKMLWPAVETPETIKIDSAAKGAGAIFTRVCGAGGGGVMSVICPKDAASEVCKNMTSVGGRILEVIVGGQGLHVIKE